MDCGWVMQNIGRYLDGSLGPVRNAMMRFHIARCASCHDQYEQLEPVIGLLAMQPQREPAPALEVRILSAFSRELLRRRNPAVRWNRRRVKFLNWVRPVAVPGVGGLVVALILVPALLSAFWTEPVAYANDIPLRMLAHPVVTAPEITVPSPYPVSRDLIVLAYIDRRGVVYDYFVASDESLDGRMRGQLANALLTSKFRPAERFGKPVSGERMIHYQSVDSGA